MIRPRINFNKQQPTSNLGHYFLCFLIALIFIAVGWFTGLHLFGR